MKIAIVGSSSIDEYDIGKVIDSYDVVCRSDYSFEMSQINFEKYGKKTDVLFSSFSLKCQQMLEDNLDVNEKLYGKPVPLIFVTPNSMRICNHRQSELLKYMLPIDYHDNQYISDVVSCLQILNNFNNLKELFIVGTTFYNSETLEYFRLNNKELNIEIKLKELELNKALFKRKVLHHPTVKVHQSVLNNLYDKTMIR